MLITYLVSFLYMATWHMVIPLVPVYATALGASPVQVGLVVSSIVMLSTILCVHMGAFADRFGAARLARLSSVVFAGALAVIALSRDLRLLAFALSVFGLADIALVLATQTSVAALSAPTSRARNFTTLTLWGSAGPLIGPFAGGVVAARFGYQTAFGAAWGVALLTLAASWSMPRVSSGPSSPAGGGRATYRQAWTMLRDPSTALIVVMSFATMFAFSLRSSFYPVYLAGAGFSIAFIGSLLSLHAGCAMLARPLMPHLATRFGQMRVLLVAIAVSVPALSLTPSLAALAPLATVLAVLGASSGVVHPLKLSLMSERVSPGTYGTAFSLQVTAMQFSQLVAPVLCGVAVSAAGIGAAFYVGALVALGGLVSALALDRVAIPGPATAIEGRHA